MKGWDFEVIAPVRFLITTGIVLVLAALLHGWVLLIDPITDVLTGRKP